MAGLDEQRDRHDIPVRLVVAPAAGVFHPAVSPDDVGGIMSVRVGQVLGTVENNLGATEVRSAFAGRLMALVALGGQRMRRGDVVAWLSVETA